MKLNRLNQQKKALKENYKNKETKYNKADKTKNKTKQQTNKKEIS